MKTDTESESEEEEVKVFEDDRPPTETKYVENAREELGQQGDSSQTEEVDEENKSLIWTLVKQVRPGMDLSKVVLPTFILEPRSFLDKLSDYYYHSDILSEAVLLDDPYARLKAVVRWYLSGFYKNLRVSKNHIIQLLEKPLDVTGSILKLTVEHFTLLNRFPIIPLCPPFISQIVRMDSISVAAS